MRKRGRRASGRGAKARAVRLTGKPDGSETTLGAKRWAAKQPYIPFEGLMNVCPQLCRGMVTRDNFSGGASIG